MTAVTAVTALKELFGPQRIHDPQWLRPTGLDAGSDSGETNTYII